MRRPRFSFRPRKKHAGFAVLGILVALLLALEVLSHTAAQIFNYEMAHQSVFRGTVRVEKLMAHINGHVRFEGLVWADEAGNPVLVVPEGSFYVKPFDVLTGRMSARSVTSIELQDAALSLHIKKDAQTGKASLDFVTPSNEFLHMMAKSAPPKRKKERPKLTPEQRKELAEKNRAAREKQLAMQWSNFNQSGQPLNFGLTLKHCKLEILYEKRHYLLQGAQLAAHFNTEGVSTLDLSTGGFGGTMVGGGISVKGTIDCRPQPMPEVNLSFLASEVDPSSLGFGMNIHDKMTLTAHFTGPLLHPDGQGEVRLNTLNLPGLFFTNVSGQVKYTGSRLDFEDVTANVYGGNFWAKGTYDLDARTYHLEGYGENLSAEQALPKGHLSCLVKLNIAIDSKGSSRETETSGSFVSGPGHYRILAFEKLSGRFTDKYHDLQFYDADIEMAGAHIKTDTFRIKDKKLTMAPIEVYAPDGRLLMTYNRDKNT